MVEAIATSLAHVLCYLRNVEQIVLSSSVRRLAKAAFSTKLTRILAERDRVDCILNKEIRLAQGQGQYLKLVRSASKHYADMMQNKRG